MLIQTRCVMLISHVHSYSSASQSRWLWNTILVSVYPIPRLSYCPVTDRKGNRANVSFHRCCWIMLHGLLPPSVALISDWRPQLMHDASRKESDSTFAPTLAAPLAREGLYFGWYFVAFHASQ